MNERILIPEDDFFSNYGLEENSIVEDAPYSGYMFETYGEEYEYVDKIARTEPKRVWTLIDGDNDKMYIIPGRHMVNRMGYFVSTKPWESEFEEVELEGADDVLKRIGDDVISDKYTLEVYECPRCAGHIGLDASYLEKVDSALGFYCPYCDIQVNVPKGDDDDE